MRRTWVLAAAVVGLWATIAQAQAPAVQLEAAKYQENVSGDLDKAMTLYSQIVAESDANRKYVAEALHRLGTCYQKKGDKEKAAAQFNKVVALYPDQTDLVALAKKELPSEPRPADSAPRVVSTVPETYSTDVDANLAELKVTFDREMTDRSWSWTGGGETYPKGNGSISYDASFRTCTMPVKLEPGKVYWVGVNSPSHRNFKSKDGSPVNWYVIVFATQAAGGTPTPIPAEMLARAKAINARSAQNAAKAGNGGADAQSLTQQAWQLWGQRKLTEAEAKFQEAIQKDPKMVSAWNGLGWAQLNQGKRDDAKVAFQTCVELDPKAAAAWNGLGWIAKGEGKTQDAIGFWEKSVAAAPNATAALNGLATTYMELGQPDKAVKYYEMWVKAEPNNADAKAGLEKAKGGGK